MKFDKDGSIKLIGIYLLYSIAFWFLFFILFSWGVLRIPIGLPGSLYPALFLIPVLVFSVIYQFVLNHFSIIKKKLWSLVLPLFLISIGLIVFCPMDYGGPYLHYVWGEFIVN